MADGFSIGAGAVDPATLVQPSNEVSSILSDLGVGIGEPQPQSPLFIPQDSTSYVGSSLNEPESGLFKAGLAFGANNALASTIDFVALSLDENSATRSSLEELRDIFDSRAKEHLANSNVQKAFSVPFGENIIGQTKFNVGSALPLFGTAFGTAMVTGGLGAPPLAASLTGAATFFPSSYSSFYREAVPALAEKKQLELGRDLTKEEMANVDRTARNFSAIASSAEVGLETFSLGGFFKGGSLLRQALRGVVREGIIEEGSQQTFSNALKVIGWKGTDDLANDLLDGVASSVVAGAVLGAGGGAVSYTGQQAGVFPYAQEDVEADIDSAVKREKVKLRVKGFKQGMSEEQMVATEERLDAQAEELKVSLANKINRGEFQKIIDNIHLQESDIPMRDGLIEITEGGRTFDQINQINNFDEDTKLLADEIATTLIEDRRADLESRGINVDSIPKNLIDYFKVNIMSNISEGIVDDNLEVESALFLDALLSENNVWSLGTDKSNVDPGPDLEVFNGVHGVTTLKNLADNLKNVEKEGLRNFSISPRNVTFFADVAATPQYDKLGLSGLTSKMSDVLTKEYTKSKKKEIRNNELSPQTKKKMKELADRFTITQEQTEAEIQKQLIDFFESDVAELGITPLPQKTKLDKAVDEAIDNLPKPALTPEQKTTQIINEPFNPKISLTSDEYREQLRVLRKFSEDNPDRIDVVEKIYKLEEQFDKEYPPTPIDEMVAETYGWDVRHDTETIQTTFAQNNQDLDESLHDPTPTEIDPTINPAGLSYIYTDEHKNVVNEYKNLYSDFINAMKSLIPVAQFNQDNPIKNEITQENLFKLLDQGKVSPEVVAGVIKSGGTRSQRVFDLEVATESLGDIQERVLAQSTSDITEIKQSAITQLMNLKETGLAEPTINALNVVIGRLKNASKIDINSLVKGTTKRLRDGGVRQEVNNILNALEERARYVGRSVTFDQIQTEYHKQFDALLRQLPKTLRQQIKKMNLDEINVWLQEERLEVNKDHLLEINKMVAEGKRPITMTFNHPVRVTDVKGETQILKGDYTIADPDFDKMTVLLKDGKDVRLSAEEISRMKIASINESIDGVSSTINVTYHAQKCGSPCAGGTGEPRPTFNGDKAPDDTINQFNYQQNKVQEGTYEQHEVDPANPRPMSMKSFLSLSGITRNASILKESIRQRLFPEEKPEKKNTLVNDEIVNYLYGDKRFKKYALEIATVNMKPTFDLAFEIAGQMSEQISGKKDKQQQQLIWDAISKVMFRAGEEIYSRQGNPGLYSLTELGREHIHENSLNTPESQGGLDGERIAYAEDMILIHKTFGIPFTDADVNRWQVSRDRLSYFTILGKLPGGDKLQAAMVYNKAELETPLLERALQEGLFKGANMWQNINRGFQHRVFDKQGQQKELSARANTGGGLNAPHISAAKYRTNAEFIRASKLEGLVPLDNYFTSMINYLTDYETHIAQVASLQAMKGLLSGNRAVIPGFEDDKDVNDLIAQTKMVEYTSSPIIKKLAEKTGLTPNAILEKLEFAVDHESPGFAVWDKGTFAKPYLYGPFIEAKTQIFARPANQDAISRTNQILTFFKRIITVNPFDAAALFMTPVFLNYNFKELSNLPVDFAKSVFESPDLGRKLFQGESLPSLEDDVSAYPRWDLFARFGAQFYNYQAAEESLWDKSHDTPYRELQTHGQNFADFATSVGGLNAAIFQRFVAHNLYNVTDKMFEKFKKLGFGDERAARLAVKFVNDTSFMLNPDIFGPNGKLLVLTFFTRNLTVGFMRLMTGAAFPFLPKNWHQIKTGQYSSLTNALTHSETTIEDMSIMARYYQIHVLKTLAAGILLNSLVQFALSFWDDDERDEHGEVGNGDWFAKKRYPQMNEKGKRSMIRTPFVDLRGRRQYWSPQIFREAQHIQQILGDWGSDNAPENFQKWFTNRLSLATVPMFLLFNRDYFGKEIRDTDLSLEVQTKQVKDFIVEQGIPLGFRKEERVTTGDPVVDVPLLVAELFGLNKRSGVPTDPFTTVEEINKLREEAAVIEFMRSPDLSELDRATLIKLLRTNPQIFRDKVRTTLQKQSFPGLFEKKRLRGPARRGREYLGKELEVYNEVQKIIKGK